MSTGQEVIIRADAARSIGSGHVRRCLTLADGLHGAGWNITFATVASSLELVPDLSNQTVTRLSGDATSEAAELRAGFPDGVELLIVDHYERDTTFETACRGWAQCIMVIDDLVDRPHDADLLIDMTLGRRPSDYDALLAPNTVRLTGTNYALLRPEFAVARPGALDRRKQTKAVEEVLISVGATDQSGVIPVLLEGLAQSGFAGRVSIIGEYVNSEKSYPFKTIAIPQANDMPARMVAADLAIGACGVTSWERCCLGLPTVAVVTADNQRDIAKALAQAGAVELVAETTAQNISSATTRLCENADAWHDMSQSAAAICDGAGTQRVAEALLPILAASKHPQATA